MWKRLRIVVLLLVLMFVALKTYFDAHYATDWDAPLRVRVYPIDADGEAATGRFVRSLQESDWQPLEEFFAAEAKEYAVALDRPIRFSLGPQIHERPLVPEPDAGPLSIALWSLRTRYWAWRVPNDSGLPADPDIRLFLLYFDPARHASLPHSLGMQKGLYGIVNVFADRDAAGSNATVVAHELLHTLGATDKYDLASTLPVHPDGYAEPHREPLYPQHFAELMGGRIPLNDREAEIPDSLAQVIIGRKTAREIGWSE